MPWVRTRMQPYDDVWVSEAEHANLLELGVLLGESEDPPPDPDDVRLSRYVRDPGSLTYGEIRAIAEQLAQEAGSGEPDATATTKGIVELATTAEAVAGTDPSRAVTPAGVKAVADAVRSGTITLIGSFDAPLTDGATPRPAGIAVGYWCMAAGVTPENAVNGDFIWTAG